MRRLDASRPTLLLLVHAWGGGVIHYARLLRDKLAKRVNIVFAWGVEDRWLHISTRDPEKPELSFDLSLGLDGPVAAFQALAVRRIDLLCTIGLQAHLKAFIDRLGVPYDVTFQAYELLANNAHLLDESGRYIGEDGASALARSVERSPSIQSVLDGAERWIACSRDLAWRAGRFLPGYPILPVRPPESGRPEAVVPRIRRLKAGERLRVLVLGRLAPHKGLGVISDVARLADAAALPIEIICLGEAQVPPSELPVSARVKLLGRYEVRALKSIVSRLRPHLAWFPFVAPETHSFVLSEAMALGLPVLATGTGAVPERVEGRAATWLLPLEEASAEGFLRCFRTILAQGLSMSPRWLPTGHLPPLVPDFYDRHYLEPLCGPRPGRSPVAPAGEQAWRKTRAGLATFRRVLRRRTAASTEIAPTHPGIARPSPPPRAPSPALWAELAQRRSVPRPDPVVDVVVPVYRGYDDTLACLHSVLAGHSATSYELVVVNDAGPEPRLTVALEAIAALGLIRLIHNQANQGFVRSAALGMRLHPERDVILLNADTIVHGDWIDRLRAHRLGKEKIGTITPWSNNATLVSYPVTFANNDFDLEIGFAELDALAARVLAGAAGDIPTGVGFCFYINRACLDEIGGFDVENFGRGYGEENDFCLRAAAGGWRNIAACDVFVRHTGEVSFRADAVAARRRASAALSQRHPGYDDLIAAFMREDPLRAQRRRLDLARLRCWGEGRLQLVFESAADGKQSRPRHGETAEAGQELRRVAARPGAGDAQAMVLMPAAGLVVPNLPHLPIGDLPTCLRILAEMGVVEALIRDTAGYNPVQSSFADAICAGLRR